MVNVYEHSARKNFVHGIPYWCHEEYRTYTVPDLRLTMCGREWPELVVVPEWCDGGTVITHCFCTSMGFADTDGPEIARAVVTGKTAKYRECIKKALACAGKVVVHGE